MLIDDRGCYEITEEPILVREILERMTVETGEAVVGACPDVAKLVLADGFDLRLTEALFDGVVPEHRLLSHSLGRREEQQ